MNYHDFKQQIISTLSDRLGSDVRITVSDILKNNDTHLDGLTILAPVWPATRNCARRLA